MLQAFGYRVQGFGFRVSGFGFRVRYELVNQGVEGVEDRGATHTVEHDPFIKSQLASHN